MTDDFCSVISIDITMVKGDADFDPLSHARDPLFRDYAFERFADGN